MIFRLRFKQLGGHVHCRLFQALSPSHTWQKNGEIVFDERGWESFAALMHTRIEMLPEDGGLDETGLVPDCICRNPRCGHRASRHIGEGGACVSPGCECGPGGWV